ncbi:MAG: hypothetical protein QM741_07050 [Rudaea sp.]|uniref:hypothetical protein n=1 Tax=Rudaea sp. TaxID=2136325 RepID=UPI0039E5A0FD
MKDKHRQTDRPIWVEQAGALLDESARDLDAATLSRLNRARQAALDGRRPRAAHPWLLPTGLASACALLLAVAAWQPHRHAQTAGPAMIPAATTVADTDADDASPEFYQNLDFYAWLDAQDADDGG